jgi:hypothetical protein
VPFLLGLEILFLVEGEVASDLNDLPPLLLFLNECLGVHDFALVLAQQLLHGRVENDEGFL